MKPSADKPLALLEQWLNLVGHPGLHLSWLDRAAPVRKRASCCCLSRLRALLLPLLCFPVSCALSVALSCHGFHGLPVHDHPPFVRWCVFVCVAFLVTGPSGIGFWVYFWLLLRPVFPWGKLFRCSIIACEICLPRWSSAGPIKSNCS